jgi:hypothetical protein
MDQYVLFKLDNERTPNFVAANIMPSCIGCSTVAVALESAAK